MMQYYKEPRVVKITGKKGWPEFFEFYFKDTADGKTQYVKRDYTFNEADRKYTPDEKWQKGQPSKGLFDIEVVSGTSLPFQKEKRSALAMNLFKAGVVDDEELLDVLDWPRKDQVLKRMREKQAKVTGGKPQEPESGVQ
jgi:hypothetical protein